VASESGKALSKKREKRKLKEYGKINEKG